ncbi:hypothetical protein HU200_022755 [Digitaria exilis]|uniref:LOB domain-containing protein n=1 Tax=Digitaria exilis TaxID=1010633 RepID=A0A835C2K6_9POAL|nr:hypothetical protein HU200_022755 [Digitaria exilis]
MSKWEANYPTRRPTLGAASPGWGALSTPTRTDASISRSRISLSASSSSGGPLLAPALTRVDRVTQRNPAVVVKISSIHIILSDLADLHVCVICQVEGGRAARAPAAGMSLSSSPCAACKLLRRKCTQGCVFAPYFPPDNPAKFANVHRVFGASNVSKLLNDLPQAQREDAVNSLAYEADARLRDPVYGCVSYISVLQLRIKQARDELAAARKELAGYIGPAAFAPFVAPPQYHPHQYAAAAAMGLGIGVAPPQHGHHQQIMAAQHQHQLHHHHQQMAEAQQLAAAVEVAREQDLMMRQAAAYAHAVPGGSSAAAAGATVAVVPPDAVPYEGGFLFQQQQPSQQAQTAMALTYQMEQSPPPSSSGQSHPEVSHQQNTEGSDEGSGGGGVVPPPA